MWQREWFSRLGQRNSSVHESFTNSHTQQPLPPPPPQPLCDNRIRASSAARTPAHQHPEGHIVVPQKLPLGQKPLVLVAHHDDSVFGANDGKRRLWIEDGKQPLRPKAREKGLMVSNFLTSGGRLV